MKEITEDELINKYAKKHAFVFEERFDERYRNLCLANDEGNKAFDMQMEITSDERFKDLNEEDKECGFHRISSVDNVISNIMADQSEFIFDDYTGTEMFEEIYYIWKYSLDKISVEMMFYRLLGITIDELLDRCEKELCSEKQKKLIENVKAVHKKLKGDQ